MEKEKGLIATGFGSVNVEDEDPSQPLLPGASSQAIKPKLQRHITLLGGVALTVSTVIGSGIFVSPNGILKEVNSGGVALFIWLGCGLAACAAALCVCELGCAIPSAGGIYSFILRIYGKLPAFMFIWTFDLVSNPAGLAIIHLTLSKYLIALFRDNPPEWAEKLCAACFMSKFGLWLAYVLIFLFILLHIQFCGRDMPLNICSWLM